MGRVHRQGNYPRRRALPGLAFPSIVSSLPRSEFHSEGTFISRLSVSPANLA